MPIPIPPALQAEADALAARYPRGTRVRYWTGARVGAGKVGTISHEATVLSRHTVVVWISGVGCVASTHVEPITEEP